MSAQSIFRILLNILCLMVHISANDPLVSLELRQVRGLPMKTINGRSFSAFRGIPYAKPPLGNLRFKPPKALTEPLKSQPFDASREGPECTQYSFFQKKFLGQEDCLTLNVYTPQVSIDNEYPVMVHIHGGGSTDGSSASFMYGPRRILDHNVVLVTFNYRLNIFGFLSNKNEDLLGNYGLLDQVLALTWVQQNIKYFGGDAGRVTIFGESAGSADVVLHLLSPLSTGLFHGAIAMSGTPLDPWAYIYKPEIKTKIVAESVGCSTRDIENLSDCLRKIPADQLVKIMEPIASNGLTPFGPVLDNKFLTSYPKDLLQRGEIVNKVPLMIGTAKDEGLLFMRVVAGDNYPQFSRDWLTTGTMMAVNEEENQNLQKVEELIRRQYFDNIDVSDENQLRDAMTRMLTDSMFIASHYQTLSYLTNADLEPYVYSYDYITDHSTVKGLGVDSKLGVSHGDDLYYLFDSPSFFPDDFNKTLDRNEERFLKFWINFATYGNPTPNPGCTSWPRAVNDNIPIYHLDKYLSIKNHNVTNDEIVKFWRTTIIETLY